MPNGTLFAPFDIEKRQFSGPIYIYTGMTRNGLSLTRMSLVPMYFSMDRHKMNLNDLEYDREVFDTKGLKSTMRYAILDKEALIAKIKVEAI